MKQGSSLRYGFSTGACSACVIAAAWASLSHTCPVDKKNFSVLFLDGKTRSLPLNTVRTGFASVIKNGGDDPDCTHGAIIYASIEPATENDQQSQDYVLKVNKAHVILRAVEGIGLCTRVGLDCEQGKWAINISPRHMIIQNLRLYGLSEGCYLIRLGVEQGEKLATKTLNARLGVIGGISILGTTGIVRPFSHDAYIATIRLSVRSLVLQQKTNSVVFSTGGRTQSCAQKLLTQLPLESFICIADFIGESLRAAEKYAIKNAYIACMPGKLCKYATGMENTHAHKNDQDMNFLLHVFEQYFTPDPTTKENILACASARQSLEYIPASLKTIILEKFTSLALKKLQLFAPSVNINIILCDFPGNLLFCRPSSSLPS